MDHHNRRTPAPFRRRHLFAAPAAGEPGTLVIGEWATEELQALAAVPGWVFSEKISGLGVLVEWDGTTMTTGFRHLDGTYGPPADGDLEGPDYALPALAHVNDRFAGHDLRMFFGRRAVRLYLEVYGHGIHEHPALSALPGLHAVLTDARLGGTWYAPAACGAIAEQFGIGPAGSIPTLPTLESAIYAVAHGYSSGYGDFPVEALTGVAPLGVLDRRGHRVAVDLAHLDLFGADLSGFTPLTP